MIRKDQKYKKKMTENNQKIIKKLPKMTKRDKKKR